MKLLAPLTLYIPRGMYRPPETSLDLLLASNLDAQALMGVLRAVTGPILALHFPPFLLRKYQGGLPRAVKCHKRAACTRGVVPFFLCVTTVSLHNG